MICGVRDAPRTAAQAARIRIRQDVNRRDGCWGLWLSGEFTRTFASLSEGARENRRVRYGVMFGGKLEGGTRCHVKG